jgi:hypothetical protein
MGRGMRADRQGVFSVLFFTLWSICVPRTFAATYYVIVAGLGGEPEYEQRFTASAKDAEKAFKESGVNAHTYLLTGADATASRFKEILNSVAQSAKPEDDLVLLLIGHGSFDGTEYKFNLVGPDVTAMEIAEMCNRISSRRQLIVDASSASGGAIQVFERPGRGVVVATKSGTEKNATVFARYWVQALQDPDADTDKSNSISGMEAFIYASQKTAAFYDSQKRLATEHAVFNDIGGGAPVREPDARQGALLSSITLLRLDKKQQEFSDPAKHELFTKKEDLEQKIDSLKYQKAAMNPEDYKKQLKALLLDLAKVQQELDR